jgi:hypothetical protein
LRCPRCGNENPGSNRFCGMCGATLLQAPAPAVAGQGTAASHGVGHSEAVPAPAAPARQETATRPAAPPRRESPAITGPSFLGLNQSTSTSSRAPSPSARRNILSIDPHSAPSSRDLDYLLDDDEPKRGGAWKYLLMLLALGLAVGFGYLRFKDQGLAWLNSVTKKPSAGQTSETPDSGNQAPAAAAPTGTATNTPTPTPGPSAPPASGTAQPGNAAAASPPAAGAPAATPPAATPPVANSTTSPAANSAPAGSTPPPATPPASANKALSDAGTSPAPGGDASAAPAGSDSSDAAPPASAPAKTAKDEDSDEPAPPAKASKAKPTPATKRVTPTKATAPAADSVIEAQKYLYGKGVKQDCDRGLRLLKPAADQANPKAMIEMGALYSAGLCTPRDLPTAYRWFAMALRKDPDNQAVQTDLQKLWGEMTQPERQLAIRLTQ